MTLRQLIVEEAQAERRSVRRKEPINYPVTTSVVVNNAESRVSTGLYLLSYQDCRKFKSNNDDILIDRILIIKDVKLSATRLIFRIT